MKGEKGMKQITFRKLLDLIHEGKAPLKIKLKNGTVYERKLLNHLKHVDYMNKRGRMLSSLIFTTYYLNEIAGFEDIYIIDEILDEKEKEYLLNIIKPFKKNVKYIAKVETKGQERIKICYKDYLDKSDADFIHNHSFFGLPTFKAGTMYRGMELDRQYTLEELCLEKGEKENG